MSIIAICQSLRDRVLHVHVTDDIYCKRLSRDADCSSCHGTFQRRVHALNAFSQKPAQVKFQVSFKSSLVECRGHVTLSQVTGCKNG